MTSSNHLVLCFDTEIASITSEDNFCPPTQDKPLGEPYWHESLVVHSRQIVSYSPSSNRAIPTLVNLFSMLSNHAPICTNRALDLV